MKLRDTLKVLPTEDDLIVGLVQICECFDMLALTDWLKLLPASLGPGIFDRGEKYTGGDQLSIDGHIHT